MRTADTVTDEEILHLKLTVKTERADPSSPNYDAAHGLLGVGADLAACADALNRYLHPESRRRAREHCAKAVDARGW